MEEGMAKKKLDRRQMIRQSFGATTALMVGIQFPSMAVGDQLTFTGFDGQTVVWVE